MFKFLLIFLSFLQFSNALTIATYNIRVPVDSAPNDWQSRKFRIKTLFEKYDIDIAGLQETSDQTVNDLLTIMPQYCKVNQQAYDNAIIYKCNKVTVSQSRLLAISDQPTNIGSNSFGLAYPRTLLFTQFNTPKGKFNIYATHLDIIPKPIQQDFIVKNMQYDAPRIVLGDLNTDNIKILLDSGLHDTSAYQATFNGFGGYGGIKMDYILISNCKDGKGTIIYDKIDNKFASDHAMVILNI